MFVVLGFVPGYVIAKILHVAGKLRIPREVELAGLDYNILEAAKKDERAVSSRQKGEITYGYSNKLGKAFNN